MDNFEDKIAYRPYSQLELKDLRQKMFRDFRLSRKVTWHKACKHFYFVKHNGKKEKEIIEQKSQDVGNCSVCWKLKQTLDCDYVTIGAFVTLYYDIFKEPDDSTESLTIDKVNFEYDFYSWLYENMK